MRKTSILLVIVTIIGMCFTSCEWLKEDQSIDNTVAGEMALSYLYEKYDEEFMVVGENQMHDSILGGNRWYRATVVKKSDEKNDNARTYEVHVTFDDGSYTVAGDTVMLSYYQSLFSENADSIISKNMKDIPYCLVVTRVTEDNPNYGFSPDTQIPKIKDDLYKRHHCFEILIPLSYDCEEIPDICTQLKIDLQLAGLYSELYSGCYIIVVNDDDFELINSAEDSYAQYVQQSGGYGDYGLYNI